MRIHVLGAHNFESDRSKLVSLLLDDILALDAGGLTSSLSLEAQMGIKAILLTHHHFDHIRDIPTLGLAIAYTGTVKIYATDITLKALTSHLIDGQLYPDFVRWPPEKPSLKLLPIVPYKTQSIEGYQVLAIPVSHSIPAVGYQITSSDGRCLFYTGDTGPGLSAIWKHVSPQLLITELSGPDRWEERLLGAEHLTPKLLKQVLVKFQQLKGYLPQVLLVHLNPWHRSEIEQEVAPVAKELNTSITLAHDGMHINL